jgi:hypothetical protein
MLSSNRMQQQRAHAVQGWPAPTIAARVVIINSRSTAQLRCWADKNALTERILE